MKYSKHVLTLTIVIVMVFLLVGCLMPQTTKGVIEGRVLLPPDASGLSRDVSGWLPVAGAEVKVVDANGVTHTVTTNEDGYYNFENIAVNPNTVVTATVDVNGDSVVLKTIIPDAVAEDENYDTGTMDPESTALALVVEKLLGEGMDLGDIDLDEIKNTDYFEDLVEQITTIIEEGSDITDDPDVADLIGNVTDEYNATTTELEAISIFGTPLVGERLSIAISPSGATASAQWQRANTENGSFTNISGATGGSYTLQTADAEKWIRIVATGTGDYTGTVTSDAKGPVEFPATLSSIDPDETIDGTTGFTRFAGSIDVSDNVESGDYDAYYIFEITDGVIDGVPQYWDKNDNKWKNFYDNGNDEYIFGDPTNGFDLLDVDGATTQFQVKIDGEITGNAYLVDASDDTTALSNVVEETITADPEAVALATVVEGTKMTGDLTSGITATFPQTIPSFFDDAGYKINSEIVLADTINGTITITRDGNDIVIKESLDAGTYTYTELYQLAEGGDEPPAADFTHAIYGGQVENYSISVTGNAEAIDTTVTIRSIISDDDFVSNVITLAELEDLVLNVTDEITVNTSNDLQRALDNSYTTKITVTSTGDYQLYNLSELEQFSRTTDVTLFGEEQTSIRIIYADGQDLTKVIEDESFKAAKARGAVFRAEETKEDFITALGSDNGKENMTWDILIRAMYFYKEQAIPLVDVLETGDVKNGLNAKISDLTTYYESIEVLNMSAKTASVFDISTGALETFTGLKNLYLSGVGLSETGGLSGLTNIEILDLSDNSITEVGALAYLTSLKNLDVSNNNLTELNVLFDPEPKISLKTLDASNNQLDNIIALVQLAQNDSFVADNAFWDITNNQMTHSDTEAHIAAIHTIFDAASGATFNETWEMPSD